MYLIGAIVIAGTIGFLLGLALGPLGILIAAPIGIMLGYVGAMIQAESDY